MLDTLAAHGAHATFFVLGEQARSNRVLLERIVRDTFAPELRARVLGTARIMRDREPIASTNLFGIFYLAEPSATTVARLDRNGEDERQALEPLIQTIADGRSPADRLLADYRGPWQGNIDKVFDTYAF